MVVHMYLDDSEGKINEVCNYVVAKHQADIFKDSLPALCPLWMKLVSYVMFMASPG